MIIESITDKDISLLHGLQPEGWPDIRKIFTFYHNASYCFPVKVMQKNEIAGIGSLIQLEKTAWLGHIIVKNDFRKQGIATAIVKHLLEQSDRETVSLIATDEGYPVYKKIGFIRQTDYVYLDSDKEKLNFSLPTNITFYNDSHKQSVFDLCTQIYGEDKTIILCEYLKGTYVYEINGKAAGFYAPHFDEGLILAESPDIGLELMKLRLSHSNKFKLPVDNAEGISFLKELGFIETKKSSRMVYGKSFPWHPERIYNRISGYLG